MIDGETDGDHRTDAELLRAHVAGLGAIEGMLR